MKKTFLGINDLMKSNITQKVEEADEKYDDKPRENFNYDQLKMAWRSFAHQVKDSNGTLHTAMISRDPTLEKNFSIVFQVENEVQFGFVSTHHQEIVSHLRKELNNWGVQLKVSVLEEGKEDRIFTSRDRFDDMAKRNPMIEEMRKRFQLDIDL